MYGTHCSFVAGIVCDEQEQLYSRLSVAVTKNFPHTVMFVVWNPCRTLSNSVPTAHSHFC